MIALFIISKYKLLGFKVYPAMHIIFEHGVKQLNHVKNHFQNTSRAITA